MYSYHMIGAETIRARYISQLRALWKTVKRLERMYPQFPDAPPEAWRDGIAAVAQRIKSMSGAELLETKGIDMVLRNLVADQMGIPHRTFDGASSGHRILDITWG